MELHHLELDEDGLPIRHHVKGGFYEKRHAKVKKGNPADAYRATVAMRNDFVTEIGKFFQDDPFLDYGTEGFFGADPIEQKILEADHLDPLFQVTSQLSDYSNEFAEDVRYAGRSKSAASRDIDEITDGMTRTFEDLTATIGQNEFSKIEGRPEQKAWARTQSTLRSQTSNVGSTSQSAPSSGLTLVPPNPLDFNTTVQKKQSAARYDSNKWKNSMDFAYGHS